MNFASAMLAMQMGHKVARKHWSLDGEDYNMYWFMVDGEIYRYGFNRNHCEKVRVVDPNLFCNAASDDWLIVDEQLTWCEPGGKDYETNQKLLRDKVYNH